jgi:START domain
VEIFFVSKLASIPIAKTIVVKEVSDCSNSPALFPNISNRMSTAAPAPAATSEFIMSPCFQPDGRGVSRPRQNSGNGSTLLNSFKLAFALLLIGSLHGPSAVFGASASAFSHSKNDHIRDTSAETCQDGQSNDTNSGITHGVASTPVSPPILQRGKVLADNFDERDLLQAYREIQSDYRQKAFHSLHEWKILSTLNPNNKSDDKKDDEIIQVSMMEHPSDPLCPYVKMEAVLPVSVQECWNFLLLDRWDETMPKMDPFYEGVDLFGEYFVSGDAATLSRPNQRQSIEKESASGISQAATIQPRLQFGLGSRLKHKPPTASSAPAAAYGNTHGIHMILARKRTKRILTFGKREFVFISVKDEPLEDGTWVSGTVSVHSPTKIPRSKAYTRAFQDSIAFYKPIFQNNQNTRTKLTIVCRIDLNDSSEDGAGGWIPMWLYVKTIGATGVRSVMNMRKALLDDKKSAELSRDNTKLSMNVEETISESLSSGVTTTTNRKIRMPTWWKVDRSNSEGISDAA